METQNGNSTGKKILLWGVGIGIFAGLGYFAYRQYKKVKTPEGELPSSADLPLLPIFKRDDPAEAPVLPVKSTSTTPSSFTTRKQSDDFPLKIGSRGGNVRQMQQALIDANGPIPGGADGIFGKGTLAALKKAGYGETVSESTFNVILGSKKTGAGTFEPKQLATSLAKSVSGRNLSSVLSQLKQLKTIEDYTAVNDVFKTIRLLGVRHTLVNALLKFFTKESDKQQIRIQLTRIGLKYDGNTWSLAGISAMRIITTTPAVVWKDGRTPIEVPAKMVLGTLIDSRSGFTVFEANDKQKFLVQTSLIKLYEND